MNKTKLAKMKNSRVKLRPFTMRKSRKGTWLTPRDDIWFVEDATRTRISIANQTTGHCVLLPSDAIHDYRANTAGLKTAIEADGILKLLGFLFTTDSNVAFEPLSLPSAESLLLRQLKIF